MFKVLAIGAYKEMDSIKLRFKRRKILMSTSSFADVTIEITDNKVEIFVGNQNIRDFDFIWMKSPWGKRQFAYAITLHLKNNNIPHTEVESERSKLVDTLELANHDINVPNTYYCQKLEIEKNIPEIERICKYPIIVKVTRGSLGKGVFLVHNRKEFIKSIENDITENKQYICQEFIPNSFDYRIIVSGQDKILSAEKRIRVGAEFRNNAHLGAIEEFIDVNSLSSKLKSISLKSAEVLNLNWTGIDIVRSDFNNEYYVLELNRRPGLTAESTEIEAAYEHILGEITDIL